MPTVLAYWHQLAAYAQAHPLLALLIAFTAINVIGLRLVASQPPTSRLYHLGKLLLAVVSDALGVLNAVRGMLGMAPVGLQAPAQVIPGPGAKQAGFVRLGVLWGLLVLSFMGCATVKALWYDSVDCAKQDQKQIEGALVQAAVDLAKNDDGDAAVLTAQQVGAVAVCALGAYAAHDSTSMVLNPIQGQAKHALERLGKKVKNPPPLWGP